MKPPVLERIEDLEFNAQDRLFHYTSTSGLFGILDSNCIWATHYRFLNDSKEFFAARASLEKYFFDVVKIQLARLKVNRGIELEPGANKDVVAKQAAVDLVEMFHNAIWGADKHGVKGVDGYIFSTFCSSPSDGKAFSDGGLLHWSTYGRSGGFAIQINPAKLEKILLAEGQQYGKFGWLSNRVAYADEGEMPASLKASYEKVGKVVHSIVEQDALKQKWDANLASPALTPLVVIMCLLKDSYFKNENEARVVVFRPQENSADRQFPKLHVRQASGVPVPFIKLFEGNLLGEDCPIERIIVGPHVDNDRRALALRTYLRAKGMEHIEVSISKVPFVNIQGS